MSASKTFLEFRTLCAQRSGRYDLVNPSTFADDGMDFFIHAAQSFLDRRQDTPRSMQKFFKAVAADTWYVNVANIRVVHEVWVNTATARVHLGKRDYAFLKDDYASPIASTDSSDPLYYTIATIYSEDDDDMNTLASFFMNYTASLTSSDVTGVIILPPPDAAYDVEIQGLFYADTLSSDSDKNFWTHHYSDIFLLAVLYQIELFNRNTEGSNDYLLAIERALRDIDHNLVMEENYGVNQIDEPS